MDGLRFDGSRPQLLAPQQLFFLRSTKLYPDPPRTNLHSVLRIRGAVNLDALVDGVSDGLRRHDALSIRQHRGGDGRRYQSFDDRPRHAVELIDYARLDPPEAQAAASAKAAEIVWRPFEVEGGVLVRAFAIRVPDGCIVGIVTHHLTADAISHAILRRHLIGTCKARVAGDVVRPAEPGPSFRTFAADRVEWESRWRSAPCHDYWMRAADAISGSGAAQARPSPPAIGSGAEPCDTQAIRDGWRWLARQSSVTLFIVALANFVAAVYILNGLRNLPISIVRDERPDLRYFEAIGIFAFLAPFCVSLAAEDTLFRIIAKVRDAWLALSQHKWTPHDLVRQFYSHIGTPYVFDYVGAKDDGMPAGADGGWAMFPIAPPPSTAAEHLAAPASAAETVYVELDAGGVALTSWASDTTGQDSPLLSLFRRICELYSRDPALTLSQVARQVLAPL